MMRASIAPLSLVTVLLGTAACEAAPETAPQDAAALKGENTLRVQASLTALATLDPKSKGAEEECAKARAAARAGAAEPDLARLATPLEHSCRAVDAWAVLARRLPTLDGEPRAGECARLAEVLSKMAGDGVDVGLLKSEQQKACRVPEPFVPTGELAKVGKLDPHGKAAISLCRDARTEAYQVMLRDRLAGKEREKVLDELCALPDLFGNLEIAAAKDKPAEARDAACLSARVWTAALTKGKRLKGKPLSLARAGLKKSCKKWLKGDPIAELTKLEKLDPKSKDARGLCARAAVFASASATSGAKAGLEAGREKACAVVEGWTLALEGACATGADRLEQKKALIPEAAYEAMRAEQKDRCK